MVIADHTQSLPTDPAHRLNALELGGGALLDLGIYPCRSPSTSSAPSPRRRRSGASATPEPTPRSRSPLHAGGAVSSIATSSRGAGPNTAHIVGTDARIDIDRVWYTPTSFRVTATDGTVIEEYTSEVEGRGMQFQALYAENCCAPGAPTALCSASTNRSDHADLDDIRAQLGVAYLPDRDRRGALIVPDLQNPASPSTSTSTTSS
jgi:predicted dehydrogenase